MEILRLVVYAISLYIAIGIIIALAMQARGLRHIDPATIGSGIFFRMLITPGLIALWPILLTKHVRGSGAGSLESPVNPTGLRRLHGLLIGIIAFSTPIVAGVGLWNRPTFERETPQINLHTDEARITWSRMVKRDIVAAHIPQELAASRLVYWSPTNSNEPNERVLLRMIDGFGTFSFDVPNGERGTLSFYETNRGAWETIFDLGVST